MQRALEFEVGRKRDAYVMQCSTKAHKKLQLKTIESKFETMVGQTSANITCCKCHACGHKARACPQNQGQSNHFRSIGTTITNIDSKIMQM